MIIVNVTDLNDSNFILAIMLVSKYPPFFNYSFRLMLLKIIDKMKFKSNVSIIHQGKLVGYSGWIVVNDQEAEKWQRDGGEIPLPNWQNGNAFLKKSPHCQAPSPLTSW